MSPRGVLNYELWSALSCAINQEVWTRIRTFVLQCSTMISLLARSSWTFVLQCSMLSRDLFQRLWTLHVKKRPKIRAHSTTLSRWLLFVKRIHFYQTQVRHCQLFVKPKQDGVCILVGVVVDTSFFFAVVFDRVDPQHSMFESVLPLAMFSFLSLGTWKYDALYLNRREKVSGWLKWNHGVSLRWHSRGRWWVGGLLPRLLPPAMTPAIALHHILRNTRMISASPSSSCSKTVTIIIFE